MPLVLSGNVGSATAATGFNVANSVRFDTNAYMHKTPGSAGSLTTWTFSTWIKRAKLGSSQYIFTSRNNANNSTWGYFNSDDTILFFDIDSNADQGKLITNRKFRDVGAWYHLAFIWNTTSGTAGDRIQLWVNGVRETSFSTQTNPDQNDASTMGDAHIIEVGRGGEDENYGYFYMAETVYQNGSAASPVDVFGEFDSDSGIWKPIDVSGLTFGTNGFYLDFEASGNLGNDANGGTDFTEVNVAATDQSTDTCTNNFCTCNPLDQTNTGGSSATMAENNLKWTSAGNNTSQSYMRATMGVSAGKWYWEAKMSAANSGVGFQFGVAGTDADMNAGGSGSMNDSDPNTHFRNAASTASKVLKDGADVTTSLTTTAEDQIVQIALDLDNQKFYIGVQGTYLNSADPAAGSNPPATVDANTTYLPAWCDNGYADQITLELNFGNPTFTGTDKSDGNGYGSFEYQPPSGFLALCTKNLGSDGG